MKEFSCEKQAGGQTRLAQRLLLAFGIVLAGMLILFADLYWQSPLLEKLGLGLLLLSAGLFYLLRWRARQAGKSGKTRAKLSQDGDL